MSLGIRQNGRRPQADSRTLLKRGWQFGIGVGYNTRMSQKFSAIIQRDGGHWIGWIVEVPGVNGQGNTREELLDSLRSALREALEMNRDDALAAAQPPFDQEVIEV